MEKVFEDAYWEYNYPVQLTKQDDGTTSFIAYMPRKETCYASEESVSQDELNDFIDNSIKKFETAIKLFKAYKEGKIDHVYYWDEDLLTEQGS